MPKQHPWLKNGEPGSVRWPVVVGIACLAAVLTAFCIAVLLSARHDAREQAQAASRNIVNALIGDVARNFELIDLSLQAFARDVAPLTEDAPMAVRRRLALEQVGLLPAFGAVLYIDAGGRLAFASAPVPERPAGFADAPFFMAHRERRTDGLYVSEPVPGPHEDGLHIYLSRAVRGADGTLAGVVAGSLDIRYLLQRFASIEVGPQGAVTLLREDGTLLLRHPDMPPAGQRDFSASRVMREFALSPGGAYEGVSSVDGVRRVFAYGKVGAYPMVLMVARASSIVYGRWRGTAWAIGVIAVVLNVALVGVAVLLRRDARARRAAHLETLRAEARFRGAMQGAGIGMALLTAEGTITQANPALCRMLGYAESELRGRRLDEFEDPSQERPHAPALAALMRGEIDFHEAERHYVRKDGGSLSTLLSLSADRSGVTGAPPLIAQVQDINARKQAEQARDSLIARLQTATAALHDEKELLRVTLDGIADAVITTDREGRLQFMNPAAETCMGWALAEARGRALSELVELLAADSDRSYPDPIASCLAGVSVLEDGARLRDRNGGIHDIQLTVKPMCAVSGLALGTVLVFQDVTAARALQRELSHHVSHDALTGIPNRTEFQARLEAKLREARESGLRHVLVFLDLDRFKIINDTAGHFAGDALLRQVAAILPQHVLPGDCIARLGGDEFGMILSECDLEQGRRRVEALINSLAQQGFPWEGRSYDIGASAGIAQIAPDSESPIALMGQADVACHAAKSGGRSRVSVYRPGHGDATDLHRELVVAADMRRALTENRFVLYAQRIASSTDASHVRYEVLLRMVGVDGSLILPADFIPAAEQYDLMAEIDRWVLGTALRDYASRFAAVPGLHLHLNLSASSLNDPSFKTFVLGLIEASGLEPDRLIFEITETALISNMASATAIIAGLRLRGCQVALDDFGIGLSSFSYLRTFPVDLVKIDGSFIRNMAHSEVDRRIAGSIHQIAHVLGARTIAESVEDPATFDVVRSLDIDFGQGWGIHRPEPFDTVLAQYGAS